MTPTTSTLGLIPGALLLVGVGLRGRGFKRHPIRVFRLPSIIATIGTLSILQGAALWLRDHPEGSISSGAVDTLTMSRQFCAGCFIGVGSWRCVGDLWLYRSRPGMASPRSVLTRRLRGGSGSRPTASVILAFVACSVMASIAGFYLAARSSIGSPIVGNQALESIPRPCSAERASRAQGLLLRDLARGALPR